MQLHHSSGRPDWEATRPTERNSWQRLAARSHGWLAPANGLTLVGFGLVLGGSGYIFAHAYWWGLMLMLGGRLLDIADGWVAERTGTKSPLGEALDAGLDKVGGILALAVLVVTGVPNLDSRATAPYSGGSVPGGSAPGGVGYPGCG